ncbi:AMP-binding protein [Undibacterium sp.]|uniref:AMP-binding protein n=1 Tax=Undibacterium sp. TaxID=1914977 RepID=UPI00374D9FEF
MNKSAGTSDSNFLRRIALGDTLYRTARRLGNKLATVDQGVETSYAQLDADSSRFAHYLLSRGLGSGDKVAMICANSTQFLVAAYGILKAGMVWLPVNTMLSTNDTRYILEHAEAKLIVMDDLFYANPATRDLCDSLGLPIVLSEVGPRQQQPHITLSAALEGMPATLPAVNIDDQDLALIMYTSGTTGRQKGVMHTHSSVYSALMSNVAELAYDFTDTTTCILPLFHCGQFALSGASVIAGAAQVIHRGFDPLAVLDSIEQRKVTTVLCLPLMYAAIVNHPQRATHDLSSLRICTYAMAPMPLVLLERLTKEICPKFGLNSGQTEIFPATTYFRPEEQFKRFGCYWGNPTLVNEVAIMDDDGSLLENGKVGEIVHRGPNVMLGYYKDPEATAESRRFGWHHTGDLGLLDQDGQVLFIDRKKDMIKTGGENVPSIKVEEVILRHPSVANVAVVGLPHPHWSEAVAAFVILKPGAACDQAALAEHSRQHLAGFEVPKHIHFVDAFSMTPTGKIQKNVLRREYEGLFASAAP